MLERLGIGNFERTLLVLMFALIAAVVNLGINLRSLPAAVSGTNGYMVSYDSPITDNVFKLQEIQPLALVAVPEPETTASQPFGTTATSATTQTAPAQTTQKPKPTVSPQNQLQSQSSTTQEPLITSILNKLL